MNPTALSLPYRSATLSERKPTRFRLTPDAATRAAVAQALGLQSVGVLRFAGEITPVGRRDFRLTGVLEAEVVQSCVVTLAPVPAVLRETVERRYSADYTLPEESEVEMTDDAHDPLPEILDVGEVALEALALALPQYPRAPGAALGKIVVTPPGASPIEDADLKPFAGLAALKASLAPPEDPAGG